MKKIVLMMLVCMVPFLTMAQKRSKKNDKLAVEYMMIKGVEVSQNSNNLNEEKEEFRVEEYERMSEDEKLRIMENSHSESKLIYMISFNYGDTHSKEVQQMKRSAAKYRSMTSAVNAAAVNGWEFISANVVNGATGLIHYYYMKRNK